MPKASYTSLVDLDESTALKFIHAELINGQKVAKIERIDITLEVEYSSNVVFVVC